MALPTGVETCVLSVGPFTNAEGDPLTPSFSITPAFGNDVDFIVWLADGSSVTSSRVTATINGDGSASVEVPVVDQAGWADPAANAFTMWRYIATWTVDGKTITKNIQPLSGQTAIDVDKVASGPAGTPVSTPLAVVTDVGGFTGSVSVEDLESLGIVGGGGTPAWTDITGKPVYIAAGDTETAARAAINAVGTTDPRLSDSRTPTDSSVTDAKISGTISQSKITNLTTDLASKAADSATVHKTGDESVAGVKTFTSAPVVPDSSFATTKTTGLDTALAARVRTDTASQGLSDTQKSNARTNVGAAAQTDVSLYTVIWDAGAGAYPTLPSSAPTGVKVREFIGPTNPASLSIAAWSGVVDLYTYAAI